MIVEVTAQTNSAATGATATLCDMKYNKTKIVCPEMDDDSKSIITAMDYLKTKFYSTGTGGTRNYAMALAINGLQFVGNEIKEVGKDFPGIKATWTQIKPYIDYGLDVKPHGMFHDPVSGQIYFNNPSLNLSDNTALILDRLGYQANDIVVPGDSPGYMDAAFAQGLIMATSQGGPFDSQYRYPLYNPLGMISEIDFNKFIGVMRGFSDDHTNAGAQWDLATRLLADNLKRFFFIGTHGIENPGQPENFYSLINYLQNNGGDNIMVCSGREFIEYLFVKKYVTKTETVSGNTITIKLDYSTVPNDFIRWFDISMILNTSATITSVTSSDNSFAVAFNPTTNLINVSKQRTVWAPTPPPEIFVKHGKFVIN